MVIQKFRENKRIFVGRIRKRSHSRTLIKIVKRSRRKEGNEKSAFKGEKEYNKRREDKRGREKMRRDGKRRKEREEVEAEGKCCSREKE